MVEKEYLDGKWKKDVTPLLAHWSYVLSHHPIDLIHKIFVAANRIQQQMDVGIQKHTIDMG